MFAQKYRNFEIELDTHFMVIKPKDGLHIQSLDDVMNLDSNAVSSYTQPYTGNCEDIHILNIDSDGLLHGVDETFSKIQPIQFRDLTLYSKATLIDNMTMKLFPDD